jgi:hypothetical protein
MPPTVREVFDLLHTRIASVHGYWQIYRQLYDSGPAPLALLMRFAGLTFRVFQMAVYKETVLALCRLTDPAALGPKHENLSLSRLVRAVVDSGTTDLSARMEEQLRELESRCVGLRELRNKHFAHSDLQLAQQLASSGGTPPGPGHQEITHALAIVEDVMSMVSVSYDGLALDYQHPRLPPEDGEALIYHLADLARRLDEEGAADRPVRSSRPEGEAAEPTA